MRRLPALALAAVLGLGITLAHLQRLSEPTLASPAPPAASAASTPDRLPRPRLFPIGVMEDGNVLNADAGRFEAMIQDLRRRGLDSVLFSNNALPRDRPLLAVSDRLDFGVFFAPDFQLGEKWWPAEIPADAETARAAIAPVVDEMKLHPSVRGYKVHDEPPLDLQDKVALATRIFRELDPARLVMPVLIGLDTVGPIFSAAQPDVLLIDVYPAGYTNPIGDFTMTGFGYANLDFVGYTRRVTRGKPEGVPLWMILQTHSFGEWLREPTVEEVRAQFWLALGEGATGIFWFIYSSQQGWRGLADNPALYDEVTQLARRLAPLREVLLDLHRIDGGFTVEGSDTAYASPLISQDGTRLYLVVVNRNVAAYQHLSIRSSVLQGVLRDVETDEVHPLGAPIEFRPGDGRLFEFRSSEGGKETTP